MPESLTERWERLHVDLAGAFGLFKEAVRMGEKIAAGGDVEGLDVEERKERLTMAAEKGETIMKDIADGLEQATALAGILEQVGQAVRSKAAKTDDPKAWVEAGVAALDDRDDDDDDLRWGLKWLVLAASGVGFDDEDEPSVEEEETPRPKRGAGRRKGR